MDGPEANWRSFEPKWTFQDESERFFDSKDLRHSLIPSISALKIVQFHPVHFRRPTTFSLLNSSVQPSWTAHFYQRPFTLDLTQSMDPWEVSHSKNTVGAQPPDQEERFICPRLGCSKTFSSRLMAAHQLWHLNQDELAKEKNRQEAPGKFSNWRLQDGAHSQSGYHCWPGSQSESSVKASVWKPISANTTLQQHKRVHSGTTYVLHTGERQYKSNQCEYSASKKDNLQRHQIRKNILLSQDENTKELEIKPIKQEGGL